MFTHKEIIIAASMVFFLFEEIPCAIAQPIATSISLQWQVKSETNPRQASIQIIKEGNKLFFPMGTIGDLMVNGRLLQCPPDCNMSKLPPQKAVLVDAPGDWRCADKPADKRADQTIPSQWHWCARLVSMNGDNALIEYIRQLKDPTKGNEYELKLRFSFEVQGERCNAQIIDGQESYRGSQAQKVIPISNVQKQICSIQRKR
jgi:hypothetical protein